MYALDQGLPVLVVEGLLELRQGLPLQCLLDFLQQVQLDLDLRYVDSHLLLLLGRQYAHSLKCDRETERVKNLRLGEAVGVAHLLQTFVY